MDRNRQLSGAVYDVENGSIKKNQIIKDTNHLVLDIVDTNKDTIGNETTPKENSMQAMTTVTIKKEFQNYDSKKLQKVPGYPESVTTKDITISYAGTNGWQDIKTDVREIARNDKHANGAFQSALNYADEIEKKYSAKDGFAISTTGHSLGGAEAIYVAVLRNYPNALTYGAAGAGLSDEQIKNYKGQIINIYDTSDIVTSGWMTGGQEKIPFHSFGIDNAGWKTFGHSREQFKLDKQGNYIDKYGDIAVYSNLSGGIDLEQTYLAQQIIKNKKGIREIEAFRSEKQVDITEVKRLKEENKWLQKQLKEFSKLNELQVLFTASGGGLSNNEQIYLDDSKALAVVKLASSKFEEAMQATVKIYTEGVRDLEMLWRDGLSMIQRVTPDLSYAETMESMEVVGCTKREMVDIPTEEFREKLAKVHQMKGKFTFLTKEISMKITELKQRDVELAQQLRAIG